MIPNRQELYKMDQYAKKLRKKHPNMNPARMMKLVAQKFNVELVDNSRKDTE